MNKAIELLYKCACMEKEAAVLVPIRRSNEDAVDWMEGVVAPALYLDHRMRSPDCNRTAMEYAKIPVPEGTPALGVPVSVQ